MFKKLIFKSLKTNRRYRIKIRHLKRFSFIIALILTAALLLVFQSIKSGIEKINPIPKSKPNIEAKKVINTHKPKEIKPIPIKQNIKERAIELSSRGNFDRFEVIEKCKMKVTAYDLSYESCQKYPSSPAYGITASGEKVKEWHTIATGKRIPFGTKIYIPYFKDYPNEGIFIAEDRGGAIKNNCIDVYMKNNSDAMDFGVQKLDVYILKNKI